MTMTWQNGRELSTFTRDDANIEYFYNTDGVIDKKISNDIITEYYYDIYGNLISLKQDDMQLVFYYDVSGSVDSFSYYGSDRIEDYYYVKNLQGDIVKILSENDSILANYQYDAYGKIISITDSGGEEITDEKSIAFLNPFRYRGYVYDSDTGFYYLQSRYYDPTTKRFINADEQVNEGALGLNLFAYCKNSPTTNIDPDGRRTYFLNGINNNTTGVPGYAKDFCTYLTGVGVKDVRPVGIYKGQSGFAGTVKGVGQVVLEMFNVSVYTNAVVNMIKYDLKVKSLSRGEQLNVIGYSGGGQVALNVMSKMNGKLNNVVLIGSPVLKSWKSKTKVSMIYSKKDPLSWNVGWGFKSYCAGSMGHTGYFSKSNIYNVAKIVTKIID